MNYCFASVLAVLSLCLGGYAQKPDTKPTDMAAGKPDYSPESFVLEQVRTTYRFENDGTGRREIYARIRVQSEAGVQQWWQVVVEYNSANEKIEIPYVRVHKADGTVITASEDALTFRVSTTVATFTVPSTRTLCRESNCRLS